MSHALGSIQKSLVFAGLSDDILVIRKQPEFMLIPPIQMHMLIDSKNLFAILSQERCIKEKKRCARYMHAAIKSCEAI